MLALPTFPDDAEFKNEIVTNTRNKIHKKYQYQINVQRNEVLEVDMYVIQGKVTRQPVR
jgi:hypothetical protein